jgi:cyanophycinase-like exopeptidase
MGSGETAPTMARVHRALFARLSPDAPAALLDTPYGFQENAAEVTARAQEYFERNVGHPMALASLRRADADALALATALTRAREAAYLFAGPGSPSYALAQWRATPIPGMVADKLRDGGIVTFASAAALTVGAHTVPVYEIYKVGADPTWLPGLDLLTPLGLPVAVIPHYDNAEGGTHDTRFCYLGEARLQVLEQQLPVGHFVLGIDSHTALVLDLVAGTATVEGVGGVTIRVEGHSRALPSGTTLAIDAIPRIAAAVGEGATDAVSEPSSMGAEAAPAPPAGPSTGSPLDAEVRDLEARFRAQLATGATGEAVGTILALDELLLAWSRDTEGTGELDRARATYRSCIVRLGEHAGAADRATSAERLAPLVDLLVDLRDRARADRDWRRADWIRDALVDAGIEIHDGADSTTWVDGREAR